RETTWKKESSLDLNNQNRLTTPLELRAAALAAAALFVSEMLNMVCLDGSWVCRDGRLWGGYDNAETLETGTHCVKFVRIADGIEQVARFLCILQGGKVEGLFSPACQNFERGIGGLDERM